MQQAKPNNSDITTVNYRCVGIDVHKNKFVACYLDASAQKPNGNEENLRYEYMTVEGSYQERQKLIEWIRGLNPEVILMESTSVYWRAIFREMEEAGLEPMLINPIHFHQRRSGNKTDTADAQWLSHLARLGLFRASFVPKEPMRTLRLFIVAHRKNTAELTANKNRLQKILDDAGIHLSCLFSDSQGETAKEILQLLITDTLTRENVEAKRNHRCKASVDEIMEHCHGTLTPAAKKMIQLYLEKIELCNRHNLEIEEFIEQALKEQERSIEILEGIPGIDHQAAISLIAIFGTDLQSYFPDAHCFAKWAGTCPGNHESAGKRLSSRCPHGLTTVKTVLVECAQAAARCKGTEFQQIFRKKRYKGYCEAIMIIAHRLTKLIYTLITRGTDYNDKIFDYTKAEKLKVKPRWYRMQLQAIARKKNQPQTDFPDVIDPVFV